MILAGVIGNQAVLIVPLIALTELLVFDQSSVLLSEGGYLRSLTGEYIIGRMFLLAAVVIFHMNDILSLKALVLLYLVQYLVVLGFFYRKKDKKREDLSEELSLSKIGRYQRADIMQSLIGQMPVILQYLFVGSFEAGITGIILLIKKLINFISGPTAKIFLPEFSKLYHNKDYEGIQKSFSSIMRIQMVFAGPLAVILVGYPRVILGILANELLPYTKLFAGCSAVFLLAATLGPCGGLMQMTDHEKEDNRCREGSIAVMFLVFFLLRRNPLFTLYGLAVQTLLEAASKYIFVCHTMKQAPVRTRTYLGWWMVPGAAILFTYILHAEESFLMMVCAALIAFLAAFFREFKEENFVKALIRKRKEQI